MGIQEREPFGGEPIEVWRRDPALRIGWPDVTETEIVRQNDDDVRSCER